MLCSGLVDDGRVGLSQRDMEPCFIMQRRNPQHRHTLVIDSHNNVHIQHTQLNLRKNVSGFPNTSPDEQTP